MAAPAQHKSLPDAICRALRPPQRHGGGEVYLIGAGPGDPDLLTLRAFRLLQHSDLILHDRLVSDGVLAMAPERAERIFVGKRRNRHPVPQERINQMLLDAVAKGLNVARLKGGDPFIFGRGGEEVEALSAAGVPFQVVPGITAAGGCSCYAGIPLTHRDLANSVRFVAGQLQGGVLDLDWNGLVRPHQTLVFYMSLATLPLICAGLMEHGMEPGTPLAAIENGTSSEQCVTTSTLERAADDCTAMQSPTLLIVGPVVRLHSALSWHGARPGTPAG